MTVSTLNGTPMIKSPSLDSMRMAGRPDIGLSMIPMGISSQSGILRRARKSKLLNNPGYFSTLTKQHFKKRSDMRLNGDCVASFQFCITMQNWNGLSRQKVYIDIVQQNRS